MGCRADGGMLMNRWLWIAFRVLLSMTSAVTVAAAEVRFQVEEFVVEGEHPFGQDELKEMLDPYLGEHEGFLDLRNAAQTSPRLQTSTAAWATTWSELTAICAGLCRFPRPMWSVETA